MTIANLTPPIVNTHTYLATTGRRAEYAPRPPAVPSILVLAENSVVISPRRAQEFSDLDWDVRARAGSPHDMHVQMPTQLAILLEDVLSA
ncbi:hypothetical protein [Microbacterium marinilacus]|uniref:hypothetical protein n=1 Tax=Microbacterium marinilacus TaxID=415209 RepID=UPI001C8E5518|nr:hypothetical protein [Microbacterium marinilacus]